MKYLLFSLLLSISLITYGQGIEFSSSSWEEILAEAQQSDKIVFVDAYTTWCGPCKMMASRVFTDDAVGAYYNEHFINAKIDMEKGEGPAIARQYEVQAYPTFLFVDGDGKLVHRGLGYQPIEAFLALGKQVTDGDGLGQLEVRFQEGERAPDFLKKYASELSKVNDSRAGEIVSAYLETQDDWSTEEHLRMIIMTIDSPNSPFFDYLVENRADFQELFGTTAINEFVVNLINRELLKGERTLPAPQQMKELYTKAYPSLAPMLSARFEMNYYRMSGDQEKFVDAAIRYTNAFGMEDADQLNEVAWNFYESVEDQAALAQALKWAERSVELDRKYFNLDTLAALHFKLGNKESAKAFAQEAIDFAKKTGEDYQLTEQLLENIESM